MGTSKFDASAYFKSRMLDPVQKHIIINVSKKIVHSFLGLLQCEYIPELLDTRHVPFPASSSTLSSVRPGKACYL